MFNVRSFVRRALAVATVAAVSLGGVALGGPAADAEPAPPARATPVVVAPSLGPLRVQAFGTRAVLTVTSSVPTVISVDHRPASVAASAGGPRDPLGGVAVSLGVVNGAVGAAPSRSTPSLAAFKTEHVVELAPLTSNTAYKVRVTATTQSGQQLTSETDFRTLRKRVRLALDKIAVTQDGDWGGKGEPNWTWSVTWDGGLANSCFPNAPGLAHQVAICQWGSFGEGDIFPKARNGQRLQLIFAEENFPAMPQSFGLSAEVDESDLSDLLGGWVAVYTPPRSVQTWQVPQDREVAMQRFTVSTEHDSSGDNHESVMHFSFEVFHDNLAYRPNHTHPQVHSVY